MTPVIERSLATNMSLRPDVEAMLRGLPCHVLFHEAHELRHPLASYGASLREIEAVWTSVIGLYATAKFEVAMSVSHAADSLATAYRPLLERLNEHIDVVHSVMRCLRAPIAGYKPPTHAQFLDRTRLPGWSDFKRDVHEKYRVPRIGLIVNLMKHEGSVLRAAHGASSSAIVLGFYAEGARGNGVIGPHRRLHHSWKGVETAFSYAFDMLIHFHWLYQIAESASRCVALTLRQDHRIEVVPVYRPDASESRWGQLCLAVSDLDANYFPDEMVKRRPVVACADDMSSMRITAAAPGRTPRNTNFRMTSSFVPMEGAMSVKPPYFPSQS